MSAGKVRFVTVPVQAYPQDKNRVQFDQALAEPLFKAVREDNKLPEQTPAPVAGQNGVQPVPPAQVRIGVFNASGTAGLAQRTADQLGERGFQVVKVGTSRKQYPARRSSTARAPRGRPPGRRSRSPGPGRAPGRPPGQATSTW